MKLPKSLTHVTWFSKSLALLIALAFFGSAFYAGMLFQHQTSMLSNINTPKTTVSPMPTPSPIPGVTGGQFACTKDSDCTLTSDSVEATCCPIRCLDDSENTVVAVNASWFTSAKTAVCGGHRMCPMIAMMCPKDVVEGNSHYSAKCVMHVCQKTKV